MQCMLAATSAFKRGEAGAECDEEILTTSAKGHEVVNPGFAELAHCAGLPSAASAEVRLQKLLKAAIDGEDALDVLLEADAADGQDQLPGVAGPRETFGTGH